MTERWIRALGARNGCYIDVDGIEGPDTMDERKGEKTLDEGESAESKMKHPLHMQHAGKGVCVSELKRV